MDMHGYYYGKAANLVGLSLIPEELRRDIVGELHQLRDEADTLFEEAGRIAREERAYPALSRVLQTHASALAQRLILHQKVPELRQQVERDVARFRALYETSIRIEAVLGNVRGLATAYHNYANDLRMIGPPAEARALAQTAVEIEEANGLSEESAKTRELLQRLSGGLSENAIQLIVAASMGEGRFANRFTVHYRPDLVRVRWVSLLDAEALKTLEEVREEGLAEPESDAVWRLTARGIDAAAYYRQQGYGPPASPSQDTGGGSQANQ